LTPHILWSNACSGHPWPGEDTREAAERRLWEEFGFTVALQKLDAFQYLVEDTNSGLIEHEYLHVLHSRFNGEPRPNPDEVGASYWSAVQNGSRRGSRCWRINTVPNPCSQNGRRKIA
jgi:isopentenyl-diphosphate delta-isomerase